MNPQSEKSSRQLTRNDNLPRKRSSLWHTVATVMVAVAIFGLGFGLGSGRLTLGRGAFGNQVAAGLPENLDYSSVEAVYDALKADYDGRLDADKLISGMKQGLATAAGDPHTMFFTAKEAQEFNDQLNNSFSGIGAELGKDKDSNLIVVSPIKGFPAEKAGLRSRDIIVSVNDTSTSGMSIDEAVGKIRGKQGTKVTLKILRDKTRTLSFTITRADIKIPSVNSKILDGNIGYMQISTFAEDTDVLARQAAHSFADKYVKGVILDLRGNPGGLLDAAVNISSMWLNKNQTVLQEKRGGVVVQTYSARGDSILAGVPTVVLIDEGSASASEITAGALRDNGVATIMGVKSYGKGSVQQLEKFSNGSELKVTVARWYRPNGQNIDKTGITPDKVVKLSDEDVKNRNDVQKQAALDFLTK